jgi:chromosome segregation ATPase
MSSYKQLNVKNHPSIATELVKFLAINTSFQAIEKVTSKEAYLEIEVLDYKKQIAAFVKAVASASRKADKAKKQINSFAKGLTKLDKKVLKYEEQRNGGWWETQPLIPPHKLVS